MRLQHLVSIVLLDEVSGIIIVRIPRNVGAFKSQRNLLEKDFPNVSLGGPVSPVPLNFCIGSKCICHRNLYAFHPSSGFKSPPNRNHLPPRLVVVAELVLLGFAIDHIEEKFGDIVVGHLGIAQHIAHVEFEMASQTRPQLAVAGETELVAGITEVEIRHRADETNFLTT